MFGTNLDIFRDKIKNIAHITIEIISPGFHRYLFVDN